MNKGEKTRQRILREGIALAAQEGAHGLSIRRVAERVKLSPMAIYRHFPDKAQLQASILVEAFSVFEIYLRDSLSDAAGIAGLKNLAEGFITFALDKPGHFELLFLAVSNPRQMLVPTVVKNAGQPTYLLLRDTLQDCVAAGALKSEDVEFLTRDTLAFCIGHAALYLTKNIDVSRSAAKAEFKQAFIRHLSSNST